MILWPVPLPPHSGQCVCPTVYVCLDCPLYCPTNGLLQMYTTTTKAAVVIIISCRPLSINSAIKSSSLKETIGLKLGIKTKPSHCLSYAFPEKKTQYLAEVKKHFPRNSLLWPFNISWHFGHKHATTAKKAGYFRFHLRCSQHAVSHKKRDCVSVYFPDHVHLDVLWRLLAGPPAEDQPHGLGVDRGQDRTKKRESFYYVGNNARIY